MEESDISIELSPCLNYDKASATASLQGARLAQAEEASQNRSSNASERLHLRPGGRHLEYHKGHPHTGWASLRICSTPTSSSTAISNAESTSGNVDAAGRTKPVPFSAAVAADPGQNSPGMAYQVSETGTPWQSGQDPWPVASPRDRSASRGRRRKKGSGKGTGKGAEPLQAPERPALPTPPQPPTPSLPPPEAAPPASSAAAPSLAEQQLGSLLTALQSQKGSLPPAVVTALEGIAMSSAGQEAKDLHRAVKQQARAKQELAKLASQRLASSSAWAKYLQDVTSTVHAQMEKHAKNMEAIDAAEVQWKTHLLTASTELAKLSDQKEIESEEDMSVEASSAWALAETCKNEQIAQQQQLMASLKEASAAAASMATAVKREGSRTPRRKRQAEQMTVDSSPELSKDDDATKAKLAASLEELSKAPPAQPFT